jgi:hypothetical protein
VFVAYDHVARGTRGGRHSGWRSAHKQQGLRRVVTSLQALILTVIGTAIGLAAAA